MIRAFPNMRFTVILIMRIAQLALLAAGQPIPFGMLSSRPGVFDVQGHRGGRGNTIENTLPSFAWGLIDGVKTLELDCGITEDGVVVVWHDESIVPEKCTDTAPATENDTDFPYVGKYIANLTLAQLRTLDCGSQRLIDYPLQLTYPGTKISTLQEVFDFAECIDPSHQIYWNIESKIDAQFPNLTRTVDDFVEKQYALFAKSPYKSSITFQSFDWRTLIEMKKRDSSIITAALIDSTTAIGPNGSTSPWLAGINLDAFNGPSFEQKVVQAASSINANILSPNALSATSKSVDPMLDGYVPFTTKVMIDEAHKLGLQVIPWTVDRQNIVEQLLDWNIDGIISDYPNSVRRLVEHRNIRVPPGYPKDKVLSCLDKHLAKQQH